MIVGPIGFQEHEVTGAASKPTKLLDGSSEFVLTYEDREGDWMLVGDVPWGYAKFYYTTTGDEKNKNKRKSIHFPWNLLNQNPQVSTNLISFL